MAVKKTNYDLLIDIINTYLADGTIGLAALEALVDDLESRLGTPAAGTVAGDVESIETKVGTNVDAAGTTTVFARLRQIVDTYLADGTVGLAAIKAYVDLIDDVTNGLAAIKAEVEGLAGAAMRGTDGAALAASWTAGLATILANFTAARIGYLDELLAANIPTDLDGLKTSRDRQLFSMDFWSVSLESVVLTDVAAPGTDVDLPDVAVDLPAGATVFRAVAMFKFRMLDNAGVANALQGDQHIGVQKGGAGGYDNAISLDDNMFGIAAATREGGDVVIGDHNIFAKVTDDDTYNIRWVASLVDVADLTFNDVQTGLRIWYSV